MKILSVARRILGVVLPLFSFSLVALSEAVSALLEETDVFLDGQDGVFKYRISGIISSNQGRLIAFCDARIRQESGPPNDIDLVLKRSGADGRTWGPLRTLVDNGLGATAHSCGFVDRQTNTLWIFGAYPIPPRRSGQLQRRLRSSGRPTSEILNRNFMYD